MTALTLTGNDLHNGKFGHTLGRIKHISLMSIIEYFYATCRLSTKTFSSTLPGFQGIKYCVKYLSINPHKSILSL